MRPFRGPQGRGWLTAALIIVGAGAGVEAQQRLYLQAVDALGAIVTDLGPEEIVVRENERERRVVDATLANLPMKVTVIVDNSEAAASAYLDLRGGLRRFFERLQANQMGSLITLARQPRWLVRPTTDIEELIDGVDEIVPDRDAATRFLDALIEATERVDEDEEKHRPVVVVFTALGEEQSTLTRGRYSGFLQDVQRIGITFHSVQLTQPRERGGVAPQAQIAQDLQQLTGGYHATIATSTGVEDRFAEIAEVIRIRNRELSRQMLVSYERPEDDEEPVTEIAVELLRPDVTFRMTLDGRITTTTDP